MTSRRKVIHESIEILKSIALLQIVMLLLLKTNHTCVGHGPNCNLKFVKKILSKLQVFKFKRIALYVGPETVGQSTKEDKNKK